MSKEMKNYILGYDDLVLTIASIFHNECGFIYRINGTAFSLFIFSPSDIKVFSDLINCSADFT